MPYQPAPDSGLSPRTRGNRTRPAKAGGFFGPIPANAGEPRPGCACCSRTWAYPRERGGTVLDLFGGSGSTGLSPRTRGNRADSEIEAATMGPIPANAGEPRRPKLWRQLLRAYPRERGGTWQSCSTPSGFRGLSPRTRGNHRRAGPSSGAQGPIPANAGEPLALVRYRSSGGAYPRERGGTVTIDQGALRMVGLSPRTRGNRRARVFRCA